MTITPEDLPEDIRALLDTAATEGACVSDQPVCSPDPRVTAQLTDDAAAPPDRILPWRIANAFAGDLIMSPGGPSGLIGGLLSQLDPPQHFSHMGIMTRDFVEVRHATSATDRISLFYEGSILGQPAPTDGIKEDALRHQWPGTVTQSIEQAYLTVRDHPVEREADGTPKKDANGVTIPASGFGFRDEQTSSSFLIDALSFDAGAPLVEGGRRHWPLVVTSCPLLTTPAVIDARRRLAAAARDIRGHYRLFAYSNAAIATDPAYAGPAAYEALARDPGCSGAVAPTVPVTQTQPVVCSSLIWSAVQLANERGAAANPPLPRIVVDGRPQRQPRADANIEICDTQAFYRRSPDIDRIDAQTLDGLYFYGSAERERAGRWLHDDYMIPKIRRELDDSMPNVWRDLGVAGGLGVSALIALLTAVPASAAAAILGISPAALKELVILVSDMPDDVANQLCNAFANDNCTKGAKDSTDWENPGDGRSVSPDNIINSWVPPTSENGEVVHGLYGWNDRIRMRPPEFRDNPPPKSTWQISQGVGTVEGQVYTRDPAGDVVGVPGARVRIGCSHLVSVRGGTVFGTGLPAGRYWCAASFTDPKTGLILTSKGEPIDVPAGAGTGVRIELFPPSDNRREVLVDVAMDLVNRYAIGADWWGHPKLVLGPRYLGLDYWPDTPEFAVQRAASLHQSIGCGEAVDDWGFAEFACDLDIQPDLSIRVTWRARLRATDEDAGDDWQKSDVAVAPAGGGPVPLSIDLVRSPDFWPVRAHLEVTIHNDVAP